MKKNAFYTIPIFCLLYYVMLLVLYSGNIYIIISNKIFDVPTDWLLLSLNVVHIVLSFLLIAFVKNKKVCHSILAVLSFGIGVYSAVRFWPYVITFIENSIYSLPLFVALLVICFSVLGISHTVTALKEESAANEAA